MTEQDKILVVSSSPHLHDQGTSKRVMFEVALGTIPAIAMSLYLFRYDAAIVLMTCVSGAILTEALFNSCRKKKQTIDDGSALVTGLILGLSLPPTLPAWMCLLGSVVAIGVAKMLFGGLGSNIFNPAMVGRAFLMAGFGTFMTTWAIPFPLRVQEKPVPTSIIERERLSEMKTLNMIHSPPPDRNGVMPPPAEKAPEQTNIAAPSASSQPAKPCGNAIDQKTCPRTGKPCRCGGDGRYRCAAPVKTARKVDAVTGATPLALAKQPIKDAANADKPQEQKAKADAANSMLMDLFLGKIGGSAGETSALAWLLGGAFLLLRRTITWHIPLAVLVSAAAIATGAWLANPAVYANPLVHLFGGGLMMGAFFIATDPVSCPLSQKGRCIFGAGVGSLIMLIRLKGGYPEGVMYAVLLMNSITPLLDRWTKPSPAGGHVKKQ